MPASGYYRRWRAAHPEYRAREVARRTAQRLAHGREDRSREYANRPSRAVPEIPPVFPDLARGTTIEFREEALAADLRQEATLAELEGRDPDQAVREYRAREHTWWAWTVPIVSPSRMPQERR